jgi:hypothetical protein
MIFKISSNFCGERLYMMLTLPIQKKWFDMIESGEKIEEYRKMTKRYDSIFKKRMGSDFEIRYRNGYRAESPLLECIVSVVVKTGNPKWGAVHGTTYYTAIIKDVKRII